MNTANRIILALLISFLGAPNYIRAEDSPQLLLREKEIVIEVAGAVRKPGVYEHAEGARVWDALRNAGGAAEKADLMDINLASPLMDESRLFIPEIPPLDEAENKTISNVKVQLAASAADLNPPQYTRSGWIWLSQTGQLMPENSVKNRAAENATPANGNGLININTASKADLESLPGIGPVTADKIIAFRELEKFTTVDDLQKVSGVGPSKTEAVRKLVCVE